MVLAALSQQTYSKESCEIIVIDDGSTESFVGLDSLINSVPFYYICQPKAGATAARNHGAELSSGDILVFLDDDIDLVPIALQVLVETLLNYPKTIVLGLIQPCVLAGSGVFSRITAGIDLDPRQSPYTVSFSECFSGTLAMWRKDFYSIGMFQDPTGGWPNWDDIELGYRACKKGYQFIRCPQAIGWHRDHSLADLKSYCLRTARAACSAVVLFQKYPEIYQFLPMFHDKTPISFQSDSPYLIAHKLFHTLTAFPQFIRILESLASSLESTCPRPGLLLPIYRWINSIYIYRGFRYGLQIYGPLMRFG